MKIFQVLIELHTCLLCSTSIPRIHLFVASDCQETARPEKEAEGVLHWGAWPGHGRPHQGMVPAAGPADLHAQLWWVTID